jgi:hypothetical protein
MDGIGIGVLELDDAMTEVARDVNVTRPTDDRGRA